ncbi:ribonuclease E inhibitor RraB [Uliginosibacterium gangwonense]|uniref:ribonuclease E inhibitor RraB n=1 Tax=Uliginosibacterium gangwonense TaxID=392736 RepID=UPI000365548E|nr:ribonuclease E inhibitor RraB [Uliginosibacterium gangwonense]
MNWPDDADGDVFRRLLKHGFNFSKSYIVNYNVDFDTWPPSRSALDLLRSMYGTLEIFEQEEGSAGYVQFQIHGPVTYESVTTMQLQTSSRMAPYGGICESWGVLQDES